MLARARPGAVQNSGVFVIKAATRLKLYSHVNEGVHEGNSLRSGIDKIDFKTFHESGITRESRTVLIRYIP